MILYDKSRCTIYTPVPWLLWQNIPNVPFFCCCFPLRTELNLSNAGLVPCGPDGKSHALSFGGESDGPCVPVGVGLVGWVPIPSEKHRNGSVLSLS